MPLSSKPKPKIDIQWPKCENFTSSVNVFIGQHNRTITFSISHGYSVAFRFIASFMWKWLILIAKKPHRKTPNKHKSFQLFVELVAILICLSFFLSMKTFKLIQFSNCFRFFFHLKCWPKIFFSSTFHFVLSANDKFFNLTKKLVKNKFCW